jgi:hypothetical protein
LALPFIAPWYDRSDLRIAIVAAYFKREVLNRQARPELQSTVRAGQKRKGNINEVAKSALGSPAGFNGDGICDLPAL